MYICICKSVTDHDIKAAVAEGVQTLEELTETLGCASQCGKCQRIAQRVLDTALNEQMPYNLLSDSTRVTFATV